ncbi:Uncharacterised protein [Delftia tsuruhatensis]|uniref:PQQ-like beta-propeller repeat protein n=1 Tax=Delftia tsuruhatensis TaxID=180282 RepID=UPI001E800287|nr:PQQ-like beta-propeller repeat protein [Delftia tsuruhatensis]CAB5722649.1 Uncharacterised protein [Delftia tsuruhatensis]CAC9680972.1 Uncharacterised protein [Delftia tsuruhatensis]
MQYGKPKIIGGKNIFIVDTAMSVADGRLYYEYCRKGESSMSFLRAVDLISGEVLWEHRMRDTEGWGWTVDGGHLMLCDQILNARTGECLFDFCTVPGMESKHWPVPVALDPHRWLIEANEGNGEGRYLLLDRRTWKGRTLTLGLGHAFVLEDAVYGWIEHPVPALKGERPAVRLELRRWYEEDGRTEHVLWVDSPRDLYSPSAADGWAVVGPGSRDSVSIDAPWLRIHPASGQVQVITPPVLPEDGRQQVLTQRVGLHDGTVYFCIPNHGMYGYDIRNNRFGPRLSPGYVRAPQHHDGALYGIQDRQEEGRERTYLAAVDPASGELRWEMACSSLNFKHLSVGEHGIFVGIAGGKIEHLAPAGPKRGTKQPVPTRSKVTTASTIAPDSPYAHLLDDLPALLDAAEKRLYQDHGNDRSVVAAAWCHPWGMVACLEYGEDPDFPTLRLLDLKADDWITLDCNDLTDAPMVHGIAFVDGQDGQLDLLLHDGSRHAVEIDLAARVVRWNAVPA